jgi:subtilase family serine protease
VGIVDAFDDPNAEADLATYRSQFGLQPCTTANGCFRKVDEAGGTSYPKANKGWGIEISIDLDMVSATCPLCHIILVEASSGSLKNVGRSVNEAISLGATEVSNSYGGNEKDHNDLRFDSKFYNHPGIPLTAGTGDSGYGDSFIYPAASPFVTAVGGTNLIKDESTRGYSETAWQGTTSGCSRQETKPSWQTDTGCATRTVADVSAVAADVASYDTFREGGWITVRGTSIGTPIIASVYALAGNGSTIDNASAIYSNPGALFDVTSGSNGTCTATYLCNAGPGYDGPTGWGTPNGTGAF